MSFLLSFHLNRFVAFLCVLLPGLAGAAELVLTNGRIYTVDSEQPWAEAVAIEDGRFVFVGTAERVREHVTDGTRTVDLGGRLVLPGLVDSHTHPGRVAQSVEYVELPWTPASKQEMFDALLAYANANPDKEFIVGGRWPTSMFGEEGPNRQELDAVIPDRPVILKDTSGHAQWLNTKALEVLGIDRTTPDPIPGLSYLYRDADGNPTGWVLERAVDKQLKAAGIGDYISPDSLAAFLDYLAGLGVTAVFDGGYSSGDYAYRAAAELEKNDRMSMRYEGSYRIETADQFDGAVSELKRLRANFGGELVKFDTIKVMFDGVSEIRTSAVLEPFLGEGGGRGKTVVDATRLSDFLIELHAEKINLHVHTVADRAIRIALDAVEMAQAKVGGPLNGRVTLCHLELIDDADFDRFAELGIFANYTPQWHGGHIRGAELTLGQARYDRMFRAQPLLDRGVAVTFSSDITDARRWRANRASPFFGMQVGHTRLEPEFGDEATVRPPIDERLDLEDLVRGYTIGGAAQLGMDDEIGSIEVGKLGNLVVLDRNIFEVLPDTIQFTQPTAVLVAGNVVSGSL